MLRVADIADMSDFPAIPTRLEKNPRTGYYEIRWTEVTNLENGQVRRRTRTYSTRTKKKAEAERIRHAWVKTGVEMLASIESGFIDGAITAYTRDYLDVKGIGQTQRYALKAVAAKLGNTPVSGLNVSAITDYKNKRRADGVTDGTIRRELSALTACLKWCKKNDILPRSVEVPDIELPPDSEPRKDYVPDKEERRLWTVASTDEDEDGRLSRIGRFVCLALAAPARSATIEALTWDRVDFAAGVIDYRVPGKRITKKRQVPVPIAKRLLPVLQRMKNEANSDYVLDHPGTTIKAWKWFAKRHGFEGFVRHDLRRTWASLNVMAGVDLPVVAAVLGDTVDTTIKHYAHLSPEHLRKAVDTR